MSDLNPSNVIVLADWIAARHVNDVAAPEPEGVRVCGTWGNRMLATAIVRWPGRWSAKTLDAALSFPETMNGLDVDGVAEVLDDFEQRGNAEAKS